MRGHWNIFFFRVLLCAFGQDIDKPLTFLCQGKERLGSFLLLPSDEERTNYGSETHKHVARRT